MMQKKFLEGNNTSFCLKKGLLKMFSVNFSVVDLTVSLFIVLDN